MPDEDDAPVVSPDEAEDPDGFSEPAIEIHAPDAEEEVVEEEQIEPVPDSTTNTQVASESAPPTESTPAPTQVSQTPATRPPALNVPPVVGFGAVARTQASLAVPSTPSKFFSVPPVLVRFGAREQLPSSNHCLLSTFDKNF